jgi:peptidoglycan/xylan/chitin deacetylase (PgdA/CDA1 family)
MNDMVNLLKNLEKNKKTNRHFIVCLSHDVDRVYKTYQYLTYCFHELKKAKIKNVLYHVFSIFQKNPYWNFNKITRIEKKHSVKSTFFFLNESIEVDILKPKTWELGLGRYNFDDPRVKRTIQWLDKNGWEIGLHGSYYSYNNFKLLKREKEQLEKIVDHKIVGIRQHFLNLTEKTWRLQAEAGFKYDSSYGFTEDIGFKNKKHLPFFPLGNNKFIEIPLTIMDNCLMEKKDIEKEYMKIIDLAERKRAVLVLNWHQRSFNEKEFPDYSKIYEEVIRECKKRNAHFCTCGEVANRLLK